MLFRSNRPSMASYLLGAASARIGDEMIAPAVLLLALAATDPAPAGPTLVAAITGASAVGGPLLGALLDRSRRPSSLLAGALLAFACLLAVTGLLVGRSPAAVVVGTAALAGLLRGALSGGWSARLPDLAGGRLPRATALDALTFDIASLAGPALLAVIAAGLGRTPAMWAALALIVSAIPLGRLLERPAVAPRPPAPEHRPDPFAGLRAIATLPALRRATAVSVISYIGLGIVTTAVPQLGRQVWGSADRGPLLLTLIAVGALGANAVYARRPTVVRPDTVMVISTLLMAGGLVVGAVSVGAGDLAEDHGSGGVMVFLMAIAMIVVGIGDGPQLAALMRIRHRESPAGARSQVFTTGASLKLGGLAIGAAASAVLLTWSLAHTLLAAAAVQLVAALVQLCRCSRRRTVDPPAVSDR